MIHQDTDVCPWDVGAHASRTTFVAGNSALGAAQKYGNAFWNWQLQALEAHVDDLVLKERRCVCQRQPCSRKCPFPNCCATLISLHGGQMMMADYFYDPANENMGRDFRGNMSATYSFGTHGVRVKVDEETGKVEILDYVAAHDVGRAINPMLLDGQVYGGVLMGVGYALTEQVILDKGPKHESRFSGLQDSDRQRRHFIDTGGH